jgi:deoxyribodipyrimidine photo-lyase
MSRSRYLRLDWRAGERWFHDTLVDADVAINAYMWQNGGHSGPDQWNFVMHPVYAAKKADPVRRPSRPLWRPF